MRIRITKRGIFRSPGDMIPVGTEMDVPDDFSAWANKWEVVAETRGKTLEVATPEPSVDHDLEAARAEYEATFGEKPHARMKAETMRARIEAAQENDQKDQGNG